MPRSDRLFELIQLLRAASGPRTADTLARELEVSVRTVYRDIAALQAMRVPVEGAAGLGYVLRRGYDLPPLNFDQEEAEALRVGLAMLAEAPRAGSAPRSMPCTGRLTGCSSRPGAPRPTTPIWVASPSPACVRPSATRKSSSSATKAKRAKTRTAPSAPSL